MADVLIVSFFLLLLSLLFISISFVFRSRFSLPLDESSSGGREMAPHAGRWRWRRRARLDSIDKSNQNFISDDPAAIHRPFLMVKFPSDRRRQRANWEAEKIQVKPSANLFVIIFICARKSKPKEQTQKMAENDNYYREWKEMAFCCCCFFFLLALCRLSFHLAIHLFQINILMTI